MSKVRLLCGQEPSSGPRREEENELTYGVRGAYTIARDLWFDPERQMCSSSRNIVFNSARSPQCQWDEYGRVDDDYKGSI